ncbi:MAG: hypothetical protein JWP06_1175 [Candidatus Saccharibacteria bacterium]|nr:hypothetical protein [Candidatus Saccharibacteria bacterium]
MPAELLSLTPQDERQLPYRERVDAYADMPRDESITIGDISMYDGSYIGMPSTANRRVSVVAEMAVPDSASQVRKDGINWRYLAVVRVTNHETRETTFGLRGLTQTQDGDVAGIDPPSTSEYDKREFIPIPSEGSPITLERSEIHSDASGESLWGFALGDVASRNQVSFSVIDGELRAKDLSQNGTKIYYDDPEVKGTEEHAEENEKADWGYTEGAVDVVRNRQEVEWNMGRIPRHEIKRDSPILNGVYQGSFGGEAITVDYETDPTYIDAAVNNILASLSEKSGGKLSERQLQMAAYKEVLETMPYDDGFKKIDAIFDRTGSKDGAKISLNVYIAEKTGVCRHQALFTSAILERFVALGYLDGQVSVDRNMLSNDHDDKWDGHVWTRYTNAAGKVSIIDVAQHKVDDLDTLMRQYDTAPSDLWDYGRPTDWQHRADQQVKAELARLAVFKLPLFDDSMK